MPFREKARALFRPRSRTNNSNNSNDPDRQSQSSSKTNLSKNRLTPTTSASTSKDSNPARWPSNVYKPGEPMPRPKYRTPAKKEHKEKLEAFSFAESWAARKHSFNSQYSPMGTRAPSRRNSSSRPSQLSRANSVFSLVPGRRRSDPGRTGSVTSADTTDGAPINAPGSRLSKEHPREALHAAKPTTLETEVEQEGDDDVGNVGLSRVQSLNRAAHGPKPALPLNPVAIPPLPPPTHAADHQPFTEQEIALALQRSHLAVSSH